MYTFDPNYNTFGLLPVEVLKAKMDADQWFVMMHHAYAFACLDGNAYGSPTNDENRIIEQYAPEAYYNLWINSAVVGAGLPMLYPYSAADAAIAGLPPSHPQYENMDDQTREKIISHFVMDPRGNPTNLEVIIDRATDVFGSKEKALDWVDQTSETLGDYPRRMSFTSRGTTTVLAHLRSIEQEYYTS